MCVQGIYNSLFYFMRKSAGMNNFVRPLLLVGQPLDRDRLFIITPPTRTISFGHLDALIGSNASAEYAELLKKNQKKPRNLLVRIT